MARSLFARLAHRYGPPVDLQQRRQFLKASLAASAGLLLSGCGIPGAARPHGRRVVVIGGGFSGLACAFELKTAGYSVTVLEARNRVGGRVLSFVDLVPGKVIEGGGELIGSNHPTWAAYRDRFNLAFLDVTESEGHSPIILNGRPLNPEEAEALYHEMESVVSRMTADAAAVDAYQPWRTPDAETLDHRTLADWLAAQECSPLCRLALTVELGADNAVDPRRQSYLANLAQVKGGGLDRYWTESEVYRCLGGNQQMARHLAESIGPSRVLLGTMVQSVITERGKAFVATAEQGAGRRHECDDVVLAVPPTVWSKIRFTPGLPEVLVPQMGTARKYLAAVPSRFWEEQGLAPTSMSDRSISFTWEGTDNQINQGSSAAGLVAFSGGSAAERIGELLPSHREEVYTRELSELFPGYAEQRTASRFMDWPRDPLTMAGYSFAAPGEVTTIQPRLHAGLGRLHFAGEHTCPAFAGYMEGALNSGARLARRLAERDGVAAPRA